MNHVLLCPGAMRLVDSTIGKTWPSEVTASQARIALSQDSHGTSAPELSGRWVMTFESRLRTRVTFHPEIPEAAVFAIEVYLSFPVDGFIRIQVTAMPEARFHLDDSPKARFSNPLDEALRAREEGKLRRATHQQIGFITYLFQNGCIGNQVDAERFFAEQVLIGLENVSIDLCVQVMRHGAVDSLDIGRLKHLTVVV